MSTERDAKTDLAGSATRAVGDHTVEVHRREHGSNGGERPDQDQLNRVGGKVERLASSSRDLRPDRELAFYGSEDLTPSGFYSKEDGERARDGARFTVRLVEPRVLPRS